MFAGDATAGTVGNMLNRAISGERQNLGESLWGGLTNAVSGRAGGYGKVKGAADAFKRGAMENAARSVMNDIHDMAGIGDAGSRAHGRDSYGTGGDPADTALMNRGKSDPRTQCTPTDTFSGGIGTQSTRGYRQSGSSGKNGTKSRFDLKKILKNAMFNGLMGGLTDTAFYGMDKAVDAATVGFLGNQRGSGTQRRIAENGSGSGSRFPENPNNLFPKNYVGLEKEVKADGKINYTVQAGGKTYKIEYHLRHEGEGHYDGNHYHVLKLGEKPKSGKTKPPYFRIPNLDPNTPAHRGEHLPLEIYYQLKIVEGD